MCVILNGTNKLFGSKKSNCITDNRLIGKSVTLQYLIARIGFIGLHSVYDNLYAITFSDQYPILDCKSLNTIHKTTKWTIMFDRQRTSCVFR